MLRLILCVVAILVAVAAVPPTLDDDPYPPIGLNLTGDSIESKGLSLPLDAAYSAVLKDIKLAHEKVQNALLKNALKAPNVSDPKLHMLLVHGMVDLYANKILLPNCSPESLEDGYKHAVNKLLPLLLKKPLNLNNLLAKDLSTVKLALQPLLKLFETVCYDVDEKTCDELIQMKVNRKPKLLQSVDLLKRTHLLAHQYLSLEQNVQLAAKKQSGVGYLLNNVNELARLSYLLSDVLMFKPSS